MVLSVLSVTQKPAPLAFFEFAPALEVADAGPRSLASGDALVLRNGSGSACFRSHGDESYGSRIPYGGMGP